MRNIREAALRTDFHRTRSGKLSDIKKLSRSEKIFLKNKLAELLLDFDLNNLGKWQYLEQTNFLLRLVRNYPATLSQEINDIYKILIDISNYKGAKQFDRERFNMESEYLIEDILRRRDDIRMRLLSIEMPTRLKQRHAELRRLNPIFQNVSRQLEGMPPDARPWCDYPSPHGTGMYPRRRSDLFLNRDLTEIIGRNLRRFHDEELNFYDRNLRHQNYFGVED